jgi:hypothetical protein
MKNTCLGVFILVLFIISFSTTVLLFTFQATFLSPSFFKNQLEKTQFYNRGSDLIIDTIEATGETADQNFLAAIKTAVKKTFTPAFLKTEIEKNLDNGLAFLNLKTAQPDISIDLKSLEPAFKEYVYQEINKTTPMAKAQFEENLWPEITNDTKDIFKIYSTDVQISGSSGATFSDQFKNIQKSLKVVRIIRYLFLVMSIIFLSLLILLARSSLRASLRWPGYGVAVSGLILFFASLILWPIEVFLRNQMSNFYEKAKEAGSIFADLIDQIMKAEIGAVRWVALVILVVGIFVVIISYIVKDKISSSQPVPVQPQR